MSLESKTDLDWKEVGMNSYLGPGKGRVGARGELRAQPAPDPTSRLSPESQAWIPSPPPGVVPRRPW